MSAFIVTVQLMLVPEQADKPAAGAAVRVAVTLLIPSIFTVQGLTLPEQSPDQPVNSDPGPGVAVRVTLVPSAYLPAVGVGTGVIEPAPIVVSHSVYCAVKVAVTVLAAS